jgi:transposase
MAQPEAGDPLGLPVTVAGMSGHTRSATTRFALVDRRRLEQALSAARDARLYRRIEAVLLVAEGQMVSEAARRVRASRLSVRRWVGRYLAAHDIAALADQPRRGRPRSAPRLTPGRLAAALARSPRNCGYQATTWTVPLLGHYLCQRHGVTVSPCTLRRRLHQAGYRWKRPRYVYAGRAVHLAQKKGH